MKKILLLLCFLSLLSAQSNLREKQQFQADSLEKVIDNSADSPTGYQYNKLSEIYFLLGLQARSYAYALKARELAENSSDDSLKIKVNGQLIKLYSSNHLPEKALNILHESLKLKTVKNTPEIYLQILGSIANTESVISNRSSKTRYAYKKYQDEATRLKNYNHLVGALYETAVNIYHTQGTAEAHAAAIEYYKGVIEIIDQHAKEIDAATAEVLRSNSLNNIGDIYEREKKYDQALEFYLKSLALRGKDLTLSPANNTTVLISVSTIYNCINQYEQAITHLDQAVSLSNLIRDKRSRYELKSMITFELHKAHAGSGNQELSADFLKQSDSYKDSLILLESSLKDSSKVITSLETGNIINKFEAERERLQQRDQLKTLQLEKARMSRNYLLGGLIFALLATLLILSRYRIKAIANRNITTISKIGQDITSVLEFEDLLYTFYEDSNKLMEVDAFGLGLLNDNRIKYKFFISKNERLPEFSDELSDTFSPAVQCLESRQEVIINNLEDKAEFKTYFNRTLPGSKLRSALYLPLISKDKILGVLTVLCNKKNGYVDQHLNMLKTLASYLTIALDNSRVYSELSSLNRELKVSNEMIKAEQEKSDRLLLNILPAKVAHDLKQNGVSQPEVFKNVTVMFTDLVDFTKTSVKMNPQEVINELNDLFSNFDRIISRNGCLRIKTIGDAYLAVAGMPEPDEKHTEKMFKAAVEIIDYLKERNRTKPIKWLTRIGIHTGDVVGGIIGIEKYIYDIFGDTVNVAFRMEQLSQAMQINITGEVHRKLKDSYTFTRRENITVKGREGLEVWWFGETPV